MKNYTKISFYVAIFASYIILLPYSVYAGPVIKVDTPNVNIGSIREGEVKRIRHVFTIRNTGNMPLIINRVKAG